MTVQTVPITNSNGTVWSFAKGDTPSDSALGARFHDLAWLIEGGPGGTTQFAAARPGVFSISPATNGGGYAAGLFCMATGSGLQVQVLAGAGVIERGTFSGASWSTFTLAGTYGYVVALKSNLTFTADAANSLSGTRIDRIDLVIADGPGQGDNGGVSFGQVRYQAGTVGSGTAPNAPANSIPLGYITFPAGTTTVLTSGMFTDLRRSTGLRGAVRMLLPGDALADAGVCAGELRDTSVVQTPGTLDRWNNVSAAWETVSILGAGSAAAKYTAAINATGQNQVLNGNATTTIQLINARKTSPLVTASGTNNTTFTLNKAGSWSFTWGVRVFGGVGNPPDVFVQIVRNDTGEIISAEYVGQVPANKTWDYSGAGDDYFTTSGISVSMNIITQNTPNSTTIGSGTVSTGLRTYLSMRWEGP